MEDRHHFFLPRVPRSISTIIGHQTARKRQKDKVKRRGKVLYSPPTGQGEDAEHRPKNQQEVVPCIHEWAVQGNSRGQSGKRARHGCSAWQLLYPRGSTGESEDTTQAGPGSKRQSRTGRLQGKRGGQGTPLVARSRAAGIAPFTSPCELACERSTPASASRN